MLPNVQSLFEALDREGVECVIIGGVAAVAHGSAAATFDLDLCYARADANIVNLARALQVFHPSLRGVEPGLPFRFDAQTIRNGLNFTLSTSIGDLDLLGEVTGIGDYRNVRLNSETMELFGHERAVLSLDALIRAKRAAGRPKDLNALPELEALLELKKRQSKI